MGQEINLLDRLPKPKRDLKNRVVNKTDEDRQLAKQFGKDYFDGDRRFGYGGYRYDGRWVPVAQRMVEHYQLNPNARILDIGCAKGFLIHDFKKVLPDCSVRGLEISEYAKLHAHGGMDAFIDTGNALQLPYEDKSYDLVISINTLHNLSYEGCIQALREIERVSRGNSFIVVDAWKTEEQRQILFDWVLTADTMLHVDDWVKLFHQAGYTGDYFWCIIE